MNGELERNASNDMPWIYIMKETVPADSPYTPSPNPGTGENGDKTARAEMAPVSYTHLGAYMRIFSMLYVAALETKRKALV